jgi:YbbR domain-containing protein
VIPRLRQAVFHNGLLKLASLTIAFLMWYGVSHDPIAEITVHVPIEFTQPPRNLDYSSDMTIPQAQVRLRAPARILRELQQENVHVLLDLKHASPGEHTYDLTASQVSVPQNVEVLQVTPSRLHLVFERSETRQVAVKPHIVGVPPQGYFIASVVSEPSTVIINGPEHHVAGVDSAITDAVDISETTGVFDFDTRAYTTDPLVHLSSTGAVHVTVRIEKVPAKLLGKQPTRTGVR